MKNYIPYFSILYFTFILCLPVLAKEFPQKWEQGKLYLENEVLWGEVSYDPRLDVVFYRTDGQIRTFTAHTVLSFDFFDEQAGIDRTFSSLTSSTYLLPGRKEFFELAVDGDLRLVRKGEIVRVKKGQTNLNPLPALIWMADQANGEVVYDYFLQGENGLTAIRHFRKQVLPLMADRGEEMQQFMEQFNFNFSNPLSFILLVNYYNHIKKEVLTQVTN